MPKHVPLSCSDVKSSLSYVPLTYVSTDDPGGELAYCVVII